MDWVAKFMIFSIVDGDFGDWSSYTACSVSCGGGGKKTRTRVCDSPAPAYNGTTCSGKALEETTCVTQHCPGIYITL